ncbi:MAG: hypothetical protein AAF770_01445 [Bacteroidota bacterium]
MYKSIAFKKIIKAMDLKDSKKGPTSIFPPKGKVAFILLKSYSQASDKRAD